MHTVGGTSIYLSFNRFMFYSCFKGKMAVKQARSQKILLGGSFEGNVDLFLLQRFSQPQSRSS